MAIAQLLKDDDRPLTVAQRLPVVAELGVEPAVGVELSGLPDPVTDCREETKGLLRVEQRLAEPALGLEQPADAVVSPGETCRVLKVHVQGSAVLEVALRLLVVAHLGV